MSPAISSESAEAFLNKVKISHDLSKSYNDTIHFMRQLASHLHHILDVSFNLELEACLEADKDGVHLSEVMDSPFPLFNVVHIHTLYLSPLLS